MPGENVIDPHPPPNVKMTLSVAILLWTSLLNKPEAREVQKAASPNVPEVLRNTPISGYWLPCSYPGEASIDQIIKEGNK